MAKTSIEAGWCVDGLPITPKSTWRCSACDERVSDEDQTTKGGWFDYNNDGKLGFIHVDCYQLGNISAAIESLIILQPNASKVARETNIPRNTVIRIWNGEAKIENIRLGTAEALYKYYLKLNGW